MCPRDHLALSGTCTAVRLGYNDDVWKVNNFLVSFLLYGVCLSRRSPALTLHVQEMNPDKKTPFTHNAFTYDLLLNPCYAHNGTRLLPESHRSPPPAVTRIWSRAFEALNSSDPAKRKRPGMDFDARCWKPRHKKCQCMRLNPVMGPYHSKVVSQVNNRKTPWGSIVYNYRVSTRSVGRSGPHTQSRCRY